MIRDPGDGGVEPKEFTDEERELILAMLEKGKAERAYRDASDALESAEVRATVAYASYLSARGIS